MALEPLDSVDTRISLLEHEIEQLHKAHSSLVRKVRASGAGVLIISCLCLVSNAIPTAFAQGYGTTLRSILQRLTALESAQKATTSNLANLSSNVSSLDTKTKFLTTGVDRNGYPASYFTACNVYIQNGLGSTTGVASDPIFAHALNTGGPISPITNGLGNLIIGYNEPDAYSFPPISHIKGEIAGAYTGSHNLIIGGGNQYTSVGSIIGGVGNYSGAPFGSILNGLQNGCIGLLGTVQGGSHNLVKGYFSSVQGGSNNLSVGQGSTVISGDDNASLGEFSSVLGGFANQAVGLTSSVTGGNANEAVGGYSAVSGGFGLRTYAMNAWAGGTYHTP